MQPDNKGVIYIRLSHSEGVRGLSTGQSPPLGAPSISCELQVGEGIPWLPRPTVHRNCPKLQIGRSQAEIVGSCRWVIGMLVHSIRVSSTDSHASSTLRASSTGIWVNRLVMSKLICQSCDHSSIILSLSRSFAPSLGCSQPRGENLSHLLGKVVRGGTEGQYYWSHGSATFVYLEEVTHLCSRGAWGLGSHTFSHLGDHHCGFLQS